MDLGLRGKVALVAAASRGLGKATAQAFANEGARVVIAARGEATLVEAAQEIRRATKSDVLGVRADLSIAEEIESLVSTAQDAFGTIDILVNNAGGPKAGTFADVDDADWMGAVNLNLMSAIRLTRLVLPGMRRQKWGRIVNITSMSVKQPLPGLILSNVARSGVVAMAKTLAHQVAAEGITVNNICPGYFLTDRVRDLAQSTAENQLKTPEEVLAQWEEAIPARRLGKPAELASLIVFLASEQAAYITGATIQVDGGWIQSLL